MAREIIVLSLGGSVLFPAGPNIGFIKKFCKLIKKINKKLCIVVGGGKTARDYIKALGKVNACASAQHETGVYATMLNAKFFIEALTSFGIDVCPEIINGTDFTVKAQNALHNYNIIVSCGTIPFITTDTDAMILADRLGAKRFVNVSNVSGVYTADPNKNPGARKINVMSFVKFRKLIMETATGKPGENMIFDACATRILFCSKIETHFICADINELKRAITGAHHNGTVVKSVK